MTAVRTGPARLLSVPAPDLAAHLAEHGSLRLPAPAALLEEVERSGLTGRGGAGFPTARKLRAVAAGRSPVVVANGAEGEPASSKDAVLLEQAPHLVLDGLQTAAHAVGARRAVVYAEAGPARGIRRAVAERERAGMNLRDRLAIEVVEAPSTFVSGQETAVVRAIEGGPALPRSTPPPVYDRGVDGRATLVQNVETLAHLALVARYGAARFRSTGTPEEPGTALVTLSGAVAHPGVLEVAMGTPIAEVLDAAGGPTSTLRGLLIGGFHGAWLTAQEAHSLTLSRRDLAPLGASPGAGVLVALGADSCPLQASVRVVSYLAGQSAQQCGPCLNGLPALADALGRLARGERTRARVEQLCGLVDRRGACAHPDGTARFVRSTLATFPDEVTAHERGRCLAAAR